MAKPRQTGSKRQRERTKLEQKQDKARRKEARRVDSEERRSSVGEEEDPDLVGIVAGPQPIPEYDENGVEAVKAPKAPKAAEAVAAPES